MEAFLVLRTRAAAQPLPGHLYSIPNPSAPQLPPPLFHGPAQREKTRMVPGGMTPFREGAQGPSRRYRKGCFSGEPNPFRFRGEVFPLVQTGPGGGRIAAAGFCRVFGPGDKAGLSVCRRELSWLSIRFLWIFRKCPARFP